MEMATRLEDCCKCSKSAGKCLQMGLFLWENSTNASCALQYGRRTRVVGVQKVWNSLQVFQPACCSADPGFVTALAAFQGLVAWVGLEEDAPRIGNEAWDLLSGSCWEFAQTKQLRSPAAGHGGGGLHHRSSRPPQGALRACFCFKK